MNIIKYKWLFLGFSGVLIAASIYGIVAFGLRPAIDFTGGTLWQIRFTADEVPTRGTVSDFFAQDLGVPDAIVTEQDTEGQTGSGAFLIKTKEMHELAHQEYAKKIRAELGEFEELSFDSIGSVVGGELTSKALWAFGINLCAIGLYVAYAFRKVSHPVASWKYALITVGTLFHDAIVPVGLFAFLGQFAGVEVDTNFIVAILLVIGFSVHDTIVVFDRIRENQRTGKAGEEFSALVNRSITETFVRSVNTSLTLIIVLAVMYLLGAGTLQYFILAILVGTVVGTYSSIFVASPLLVLWQSLGKK